MPSAQKLKLPKVTPGKLIEDSTAWTPEDFAGERSWARPLDAAMIAEIADAAKDVLRRGIAPKDVRAADFPLEKTLPLIDALYRDLEADYGFAVLSEFPVDDFDDATLQAAYCGLCSHFGTITLQNREGEFLLEVTDKGLAYDEQMRGYHSSAYLNFHNDGTNTVTLLCQETAVEGGLSMLLSGPTAYNEIVRNHPEYLDILHRGFHHHLRNQREPDDPVVTPYRTPVISFYNDLFHMAYARPSINFCEAEGIVITPQEKAALDYFDSVITRPELALPMELRKGDLQFVNNFLVLHSRTAYKDGPNQRRKLLRLWLDDENSQRLGPGKMDWYLPAVSRFTRLGGLDSLEMAAE